MAGSNSQEAINETDESQSPSGPANGLESRKETLKSLGYRLCLDTGSAVAASKPRNSFGVAAKDMSDTCSTKAEFVDMISNNDSESAWPQYKRRRGDQRACNELIDQYVWSGTSGDSEIGVQGGKGLQNLDTCEGIAQHCGACDGANGVLEGASNTCAEHAGVCGARGRGTIDVERQCTEPEIQPASESIHDIHTSLHSFSPLLWCKHPVSIRNRNNLPELHRRPKLCPMSEKSRRMPLYPTLFPSTTMPPSPHPPAAAPVLLPGKNGSG